MSRLSPFDLYKRVEAHIDYKSYETDKILQKTSVGREFVLFFNDRVRLDQKIGIDENSHEFQWKVYRSLYLRNGSKTGTEENNNHPSNTSHPTYQHHPICRICKMSNDQFVGCSICAASFCFECILFKLGAETINDIPSKWTCRGQTREGCGWVAMKDDSVPDFKKRMKPKQQEQQHSSSEKRKCREGIVYDEEVYDEMFGVSTKRIKNQETLTMLDTTDTSTSTTTTIPNNSPRTTSTSHKKSTSKKKDQININDDSNDIDDDNETYSIYRAVKDDNGENLSFAKRGTYLASVNLVLEHITKDGRSCYCILMDGEHLIQSQSLRVLLPYLNIIVPARNTYHKAKKTLQIMDTDKSNCITLKNQRFNEAILQPFKWSCVIIDHEASFLGAQSNPFTSAKDDLTAILVQRRVTNPCVLSVTCFYARNALDFEETKEEIEKTILFTGYQIKHVICQSYRGTNNGNMMAFIGLLSY